MRLWRRWFFSLALIGILLAASLLRSYHLTEPLADWHSFRQADTASVTREFVKHGIDPLRPRYHDISNIQSGEFNPEGWRMVEFPLINVVLAWVLRLQPNWDLVVTSRIASILASLVAVSALSYLVSRVHSKAAGLVSGAVLGFMPFAIYYGRVILPEPFLVGFVSLSLLLWWIWLERRERSVLWLLVSAGLFAAAALVKPMAVFFIPAYVGLWFQVEKKQQRGLQGLLFAGVSFFISLLPLLAWRNWIEQFPTGIPASDWLLNGNGIRLKPAWWRWIFADRIGRLMFGYWGAALLVFGLLPTFPQESVWKKTWQKGFSLSGTISFLHNWLQRGGGVLGLSLGMFAYLVIFASGNVQHDYYQALILPWLAWLWGLSAVWLVQRSASRFEQYGTALAILLIAAFSWLFAWYHVKDFFGVQNWAMVRAGQAVDRIAAPDDLVIAPYFGDTAFLFQTNRRGWPLGFEIEEKISQGARIYVSTSMDDEANDLARRFSTLEKTEEYIIIDLRQPIATPAAELQE